MNVLSVKTIVSTSYIVYKIKPFHSV